MTNIEFIRGVLEGIGDTTIDLSAYSTDGDYTVYLDENGHVNRYWSCSADEQVDLDEPGTYTDVEDDLDFIMYALQTEIIKVTNHFKNLMR